MKQIKITKEIRQQQTINRKLKKTTSVKLRLIGQDVTIVIFNVKQLRYKALRRLKQNIIIKWHKNDFCNVYLFIELLTRRRSVVNPMSYFWYSEKYFEHL